MQFGVTSTKMYVHKIIYIYASYFQLGPDFHRFMVENSRVEPDAHDNTGAHCFGSRATTPAKTITYHVPIFCIRCNSFIFGFWIIVLSEHKHNIVPLRMDNNFTNL